MPLRFEAIRCPGPDVLKAVEALDPGNPLVTPGYAGVLSETVGPVWALTLHDGAQMTAACLGATRHGWPFRRLLVLTLSSVPEGAEFWQGLLAFCRRRHVSILSLDTMLSTVEHPVPPLPRESHRARRNEYTLELHDGPMNAGLAGGHKNNYRKAAKAGVTTSATREADAAEIQVALMDASAQRRQARGELMPAAPTPAYFQPYLRHGVGEFFQARLGEKVVSSVFFVMAGQGAYYHAGGTSPEGMECGASAFLMLETAQLLRRRGMKWLHLAAAAEDATGLNHFKAGFGAAQRKCTRVDSWVGPGWLQPLAGLARRILRRG